MSDIIGVYTKEQPQPQGMRPKSFLINPRTFMKGGINKGMPPYLLKEDEWHNSRNFIFDYDRAKSIASRMTIDQLVADTENVYGTGKIDTSVCLGCRVPPPANPFVDLTVQLSGLLWSLPCTSTPTGGSVSGCSCAGVVVSTKIFQGVPGVIYDAVIRIRGIVEKNAYNGGTDESPWYIGGGGGLDGVNVYELSIDNPSQTFFINSIPYADAGLTDAYLIDYQKTIKVTDGATLTFYANSVDAAEHANQVNGTTTMLSVADDDPTHPVKVVQPYNGQFAQMDCLSLTPES